MENARGGLPDEQNWDALALATIRDFTSVPTISWPDAGPSCNENKKNKED